MLVLGHVHLFVCRLLFAVCRFLLIWPLVTVGLGSSEA